MENQTNQTAKVPRPEPIDKALASQMQPQTGDGTWSGFMESPGGKAALMQLGLSLMMGIGSNVPLPQQLALGIADASGAMYRASNPMLNPQRLEAQRIAIQAQRPYWEEYLGQQRYDQQGQLLEEQGRQRMEGETAERETQRQAAVLRGGIQEAGHKQNLSEIGARKAAELATTQYSDKLARERAKYATGLNIAEAEQKALIDIGQKTIEGNGEKFDRQLFTDLLNMEKDIAMGGLEFGEGEAPDSSALLDKALQRYVQMKRALTPTAPAAPAPMPPVVE